MAYIDILEKVLDSNVLQKLISQVQSLGFAINYLARAVILTIPLSLFGFSVRYVMPTSHHTIMTLKSKNDKN